MFHLELRRFPYIARAFNLSEPELRDRFLIPWARGQPVALDNRRWAPERARLTVLEAPRIPPEQRGLGRGWSAVTRDGKDVTAALLEAIRSQLEAQSPAAALRELKTRLASAPETEPLALERVMELTPERSRPSERLALAERAVWELLHEGRLVLVSHGEPVAEERWASVLLEWRTWATGSAGLRLRSAVDR